MQKQAQQRRSRQGGSPDWKMWRGTSLWTIPALVGWGGCEMVRSGFGDEVVIKYLNELIVVMKCIPQQYVKEDKICK